MKVLIVEDEETMARSLRLLLKKEGYDAAVARDGPAAVEAARREAPDLILLDVMLPGLDGIEVCRQVRAFSLVPIIMLTARTAEVDKVVGLEVGADDYVTKPFSPRELVARVKAHLRRAQMAAQSEPQTRVAAGGIVMDVARRQVLVRGREVALSPKEFELLRLFITYPGRVLGRNFLLDRVWGADFFGDVRTLDVHVRWLREKIERDPGRPEHLLTVHGVGYRLAG
ncbi:MAG: response regulator transcription factor [Armatimonadetes bacterium]|nr:response regulator transcription factor [Armatimonadota bacterium]